MAKRVRKERAAGQWHQVNPAGAMKIIPCANPPFIRQARCKAQILSHLGGWRVWYSVSIFVTLPSHVIPSRPREAEAKTSEEGIGDRKQVQSLTTYISRGEWCVPSSLSAEE